MDGRGAAVSLQSASSFFAASWSLLKRRRCALVYCRKSGIYGKRGGGRGGRLIASYCAFGVERALLLI